MCLMLSWLHDGSWWWLGPTVKLPALHEYTLSLLSSKGEVIYSLIAHVLCVCDVIMNTLCMTNKLFYHGFFPLPRICWADFLLTLKNFLSKKKRHIWVCFLLPFWEVLMFEGFVPLTEAKKRYVSNTGQSASLLLVRCCYTHIIAGLALYSTVFKKPILWKVAESEMLMCQKERYRSEPTECVFQTCIVNSNLVLLTLWKVLPTLQEKLIEIADLV